MYDHVGLRTPDLESSLAFYRAALAPLGHGVIYQDASTAGIGSDGAGALWLHATKAGQGSGAHVAFKASDRAAVDAFYAAALAAGGTDNGAPGLRTDYAPNYYAAFVLDALGNNIEAVCML